MSSAGGPPSQNNKKSLNINSGRDVNIDGDVTVVGRDQITNYYYIETPLSPAERQNRANLMTNVRQTWIAGVLKQSLYTEVQLELGKVYEPTAVSRTWNLALHQAEVEPQPIPDEQTILDVYRQCGANLLILGEPGSGKTMTLLLLAEALLDEAVADEGRPVPVVLNLSSWALRPAPLRDWLVISLSQQYQLSKQYADELLSQQRITLLLDGLDEVASDQRPACAEAINIFKAEQQMSVVVCSRVADYKSLGQKLNLSHAIRLQPLIQTQIDAYLAGYDPGLSALREALPQDEALRALTETPLMLAVMTLAYQNATAEELATQAEAEDSTSVRRAHIFDRYIEKMFTRRPLQGDYDQQQAHHWLSQLAFQMFVHTQSIYYIELMQPTWIPTGKGSSNFRSISTMLAGSIAGLIGMVSGTGWTNGLIIGLIAGVLASLVNILNKWIILQENPQLHWPQFGPFLSELGNGLFVGILLNFILWASIRSDFGLSTAIVTMLSCGLSASLSSLIQERKSEERLRPNQGILSTFRLSLMYIGLHGLIFICLFVLIDGLSVGLNMGISIGLIFALVAWISKRIFHIFNNGLYIGLISGINTFVQHYTLRCLLTQSNILPYWRNDKKLITFLDDMVAHIFLRRVGGGWVFIHRSLLEHFAAQVNPDDIGWENWSGNLRDPRDLRDQNSPTAS